MITKEDIRKLNHAVETVNILWVSHHSNRGDAAIEGLEDIPTSATGIVKKGRVR